MRRLANPGKAPLDPLILESRQDQGEGRDETPARASGGHPLFDRKHWDSCGQWDDIGNRDDDDGDHDESLNDSSGSQDEDNVNRSHRNNERVTSGVVLGARTPRKDLLGKVTLPYHAETSKGKKITPPSGPGVATGRHHRTRA